MTKYFDSADPKNWLSVDIPGVRGDIFDPKNGSAVDVESLYAISDTANRVLHTHLFSRYPLCSSLIVHGLEVQGKYMSKGPPGILRAKAKDLKISAGMAIIQDETGHQQMLIVEEEIRLLEHIKDNQDLALVLSLEIDDVYGLEGDILAYESCNEKLSFVSSEEAKKSHYISIAKGLGNDFWYTDIQRVWRPEHHGIQLLNQYFDQLEDVIWDSDRHGLPAAQQMLGMDWKLYQAKASSAVTAARCTLSGRSSSSEERIRTLRNLYWQLQRSVEDASLALMTMLGKEESMIIGDYADVFQEFPAEWK